MPRTTGTSTQVTMPRLIFLALVIVAGLTLFFVLAPRTQPVVLPEVEAKP
jgi:hypothetical protein